MGLVVLKYFDSLIDAEMLKSKLNNQEIECYLFNQHMSSLLGITNPIFNRVKLMIDTSDLERATAIIDKIESTPMTDQNGKTLTCPNCQSENIHYGYKSINSNAGKIGFIMSLLALSFPFLYKTLYRCNDCKTTFTNS